jgi:hypothetical protein
MAYKTEQDRIDAMTMEIKVCDQAVLFNAAPRATCCCADDTVDGDLLIASAVVVPGSKQQSSCSPLVSQQYFAMRG